MDVAIMARGAARRDVFAAALIVVAREERLRRRYLRRPNVHLIQRRRRAYCYLADTC